MKYNFISMQAERLLREMRYKRTWKRMAAVLSCVVVVCTISALMLPAITLNEPTCGLEEHTHTTDCYAPGELQPVCGLEEAEAHIHDDSCYETEQIVVDAGHTHDDSCYTMVTSTVPTCGKAETSGHTHDDSCKATGTELICTMAETAGHQHTDACSGYVTQLICTDSSTEHVHTDDCYGAVLTKICTLPEEAGHTHDASCYAAAGSIICGQEEVPFHIHGDDCYGLVRDELTCTLTEQAPVTQAGETRLVCEEEEVIPHTHTMPDCYEVVDGQEVWTCTLDEVILHIHTDECMGTPDVLVCELTEHTHTSDCVPTGDVTEESAEIWEATLPDSLPMGWGNRLKAVAQSQLGYAQADDNTVTDEQGTVLCYSRYGVWAGAPYGPWNSHFTAFCLYYSGIAESAVDYDADPAVWLSKLDGLGYVSSTPAVGDIAFLDSDGDGAADRTGIVTALTADGLIAIEGDAAGRVGEVSRSMDDSSLCGFGEMTAMEEALAAELSDTYSVSIYTDDTYTQLLTDGHTMTVTGYVPEGVTVRGYPVTAIIGDRTVVGAYALTAVDAEGNPWAPEQPLTLAFEDLPEYKLWAIYTPDVYGEWAVAMSTDTEDQDVALTVTAFGSYALVQTVDLNTIAEPGNPEAMQALAASGYFTYWEDFINQINQPVVNSFARRAMALLTDTAEPYAETGSSQDQVISEGGTEANTTDGVSLSKTIAGTDVENVFDITLTVNTVTNVKEYSDDPDMSVVIVMDISNTMTETFGDTTRYEAAMAAAEIFLNEFAEETNGVSRVGFVAFNTDAHEIFPLSSCKDDDEAAKLKDTMRANTGAIINSDGYSGSHKRFTNIEAGLKRAYYMLEKTDNPQKYIVFLSDGFPTTYIDSGYVGYDPYCKSGTLGTDGVFGDMVWGGYSIYGTSYSDKAAIKAHAMADKIKATGTNIFSVGVDVGGQNIDRYLYTNSNDPDKYNSWAYKTAVVDRPGYYWRLDSSGNRDKNPNRVVDRGTNVGVTIPFEIGSATEASAFKNWLGNSIGSGYYYDSTDSDGMKAAFNAIFKEIKSLNESTNQNKWIATDPMPIAEEETESTMEFIGFYNKSGQFLSYPTTTSLAGTAAVGAENTASYDGVGSKINWDLKNSGFSTTVSGTTTTYHYEITYRVRLKNEMSVYWQKDPYDFEEDEVYVTNGETLLYYQVITTTNGVREYSDIKSLEFPYPSVEGYLGELTFKKVGEHGGLVSGAEFTLTHDTTTCSVCRGDGATPVTIAPFTATSDANGVVTFSEVPSGHVYTMVETVVPAGFYSLGYTYQVVVSYDEVSVTEYKADGTPTGNYWTIGDTDMTVVNFTGYELPSTGGVGTWPYMVGGLAVMLAAGAMMVFQYKRRKGEARN